MGKATVFMTVLAMVLTAGQVGAQPNKSNSSIDLNLICETDGTFKLTIVDETSTRPGDDDKEKPVINVVSCTCTTKIKEPGTRPMEVPVAGSSCTINEPAPYGMPLTATQWELNPLSGEYEVNLNGNCGNSAVVPGDLTTWKVIAEIFPDNVDKPLKKKLMESCEVQLQDDL